jgi:hypothetical protein
LEGTKKDSDGQERAGTRNFWERTEKGTKVKTRITSKIQKRTRKRDEKVR